MEQTEQLRRDVESLHKRLNTLEQAAPPPQAAPAAPSLPDAAVRAELARLSQIADQYAELRATVTALELRLGAVN